MTEPTVGTILVHSIGCGCDSFWQVTKRTPKTVTARKIKYEITERNISYQSMKIAPIKDAFEEPRMIIRLRIYGW